MGAIWSWLGYGDQGRTDDPNPVTGLTSRDCYLIKTSWGKVRQKPTENGIALFQLFFKNNPTYQQFFPFRGVPADQLPKNKKLQAHANSVIYAFSSIVDSIDDPDMLASILHRIGESHGPRNITEETFINLKATMIELFTSVFSAKEVEAWKKALTVATDLMVKALNEARNK
ncbi:hypothetical protein NQ315_007305 [Exocentrus adspersus]|uniref:Globin domain-containing protein n=1 Tax=Exocentrus adspersus TaxID=1586481 RepID=A0AAV8WDU9_9CUCU|nr:hypothetical protein NQ315_007305 [Exocentrus adspersus]